MAAFNVGKTEDKRVRTCISRRRVDRDNDAVETNRSMVRVTVVKTYKSRKSMQTTKNNLLATYLVESLKKKRLERNASAPISFASSISLPNRWK